MQRMRFIILLLFILYFQIINIFIFSYVFILLFINIYDLDMSHNYAFFHPTGEPDEAGTPVASYRSRVHSELYLTHIITQMACVLVHFRSYMVFVSHLAFPCCEIHGSHNQKLIIVSYFAGFEVELVRSLLDGFEWAIYEIPHLSLSLPRFLICWSFCFGWTYWHMLRAYKCKTICSKHNNAYEM